MRLVEAVRSTGSQLERAVDPTVGHHRAPAQKGERSRMFHKSGTGARGGAGPALSVLGRPPARSQQQAEPALLVPLRFLQSAEGYLGGFSEDVLHVLPKLGRAFQVERGADLLAGAQALSAGGSQRQWGPQCDASGIWGQSVRVEAWARGPSRSCTPGPASQCARRGHTGCWCRLRLHQGLCSSRQSPG